MVVVVDGIGDRVLETAAIKTGIFDVDSVGYDQVKVRVKLVRNDSVRELSGVTL